MRKTRPTLWSPRSSWLLLTAVTLTPNPVFADAPASGALPLRDVVLFSTGVGYFGRAGQVDGDAQVDLHFRAPQVPDILKSLVIQDSAGPVQPVTYSIADWLGARAQPTDIKVAADGTIGSVLRTFQGANFHIERPSGALEGRLISVSTQRLKTGDEWNDVEVASLLTAAGLQVVRLDDATVIRLTDPQLDARFRASLEHLAAGFTAATDDGLRTLSLHYHGKGQRAVSAGYLQETPAWKTTYRLVLDENGKAFLQGWAIVENPTDEDWDGVNLTLVSGQPVSFIQDLYAPIYVSRPTVPPLIVGSSQPQTYGAGYGNAPASNSPVHYDRVGANVGNDQSTSDALAARPFFSPRYQRPMGVGGFGVGGLSGGDDKAGLGLMYDSVAASNQNPAANGAQRGELFAYAIDGPITLHSGDAAMVPIVGTAVDGEGVSVVTGSDSEGELSPANGFLLENSSGAHLQGGPITVYADGIYAGDALTQDVSPGETRLISYASDLDLNGRTDHVNDESSITKLSALEGVLSETRLEVKTLDFVFKNKSARPKTLILQVPATDPRWSLQDPKQSYEKSTDGLRFRIAIKAGETVDYAVPFQRETTTTSNIWDYDGPRLIAYLNEPALSPDLKAKLMEVQNRRAAIADTQAQRAAKEKALSDITDDQARIRGNMQYLDHDSALYKEYVTKLEGQESQVEALHEAIALLHDQEDSEQKDLRAYVDALSTQ